MEALESGPDYLRLSLAVRSCSRLSTPELLKLRNSVLDLLEWFYKTNGIVDSFLRTNGCVGHLSDGQSPLDDWIEIIDKAIGNPPLTTKDETVNGYRLWTVYPHLELVSPAWYKALKDIWRAELAADTRFVVELLRLFPSSKASKAAEMVSVIREYAGPLMDKDAFLEYYGTQACDNWRDMNTNGELLFHPPHTIGRTFQKNGEALYALPFPKRFLLATIEIGCRNGRESVRYSNFLGVWMTRRMKAETDLLKI